MAITCSTGLGTFEEVPPGVEEMNARRAEVKTSCAPILWPRCELGVVGFAYAAQFRPRAAYRYSVEDSIYLSPDAVGQGVGRTLAERADRACERLGKRQMVAVIGDSANAASIGLHAALRLRAHRAWPTLGFKFGRWVDIVWMQRTLTSGRAPP